MTLTGGEAMNSYQAIYDAVRTSLRNTDIGEAVHSAIRDINVSFYCEQITAAFTQAVGTIESNLLLPHVLMRPKIQMDGNQWCALYGENLMEGVAGFGDTPELAMVAFDKAWKEANP